MTYDDDRFGLEQTAIIHLPPPTDTDDNEVILRLQWFNNIKLLEARASIVATAYDRATSTLQLYLDDGSIGAIVLTTETVGTIVDASLTDTTISSTSSLEVQINDEGTTTGVCDLILQYQEMFTGG